MDTSEMRSLEEKARAIVATLSELEDETSRQRRMGEQLEESKAAILAVASRLSDTAEKLTDAIALLRRSTLAEDIDHLDSKIDEVKGLADLAKEESRQAERLCRTTTELASSVEASTKQVDGRLDDIRDSCEELLKALGEADEGSAQRDADFAKRLDTLEEVIGRIDRNTQKGFGKERAKHAAW
jgi:uncharacterized phage infection (PIP) family protein YhgE